MSLESFIQKTILNAFQLKEPNRNPVKIESLLFSKKVFKSVDQAKGWASANSFATNMIEDESSNFRMRQGLTDFSKLRTIELADGVRAVVGKVKKGEPSSSSVHVNVPMGEEKLRKGAAMMPDKTAGELHDHFLAGHDTIGGTVHTGSKGGSEANPLDGADNGSERFVFGPLVFDIDKARKMGGLEKNGTAAVSPNWSHKINVDPKAALKSKSDNPVMIAQIPTTNGPEKLLIDGHHRMHKAMTEGKPDIDAHLFSPEESMELLNCPPDMMEKMKSEIKASDKGKVGKDTNENQGETVGGIGRPSLGGAGDNTLDGMYSMQAIVDGMDWELENNTSDPDLAKEMALSNLQDDGDHYTKLRLMDESGDNIATNGAPAPLAKGLRVDVGSGQNREPGFLGLDLQKHDHGTIVHDVHMGMPFPDDSCSQVLMRNSLQHMDELSQDPKPLLAEINRSLMPGGQFVYEGPEKLENQPDFLKETWSEKLKDEQDQLADDNGVAKAGLGPNYRQEFTKVVPDAATANDSEPRIGISQDDDLPADALMAMDALGYAWSDATSSGRGNRLHGYPSQGALTKEHDEQNLDVLQDALSQFFDEEKEEDEVSKIMKAAMIVQSEKTGGFKICKSDNDKQIVYGVVLEPHTTDLQDDWMKPEEIEKTAHFFMMNGQTIGRGHEEKTQCVPVESYIAPVDFPFDGQYGEQVVKKGSWVLGVKVNDPEDWAKVKTGEYTGFSVGGWGQRTEKEAPAL
jgi:SAM-dependent methyltransferase